MTVTALPKEWFFLIKGATRDLIARAGGLERAAALVDRSKSTVHRWGDADKSDLIPLDCLLLLERETGATPVTAAQAAVHGLTLAPRATEAQDGGMLAAFARVASAGARLTATVAEAQADGVITVNEQGKISDVMIEERDALDDLAAAIAAGHGQPLKVFGGP